MPESASSSEDVTVSPPPVQNVWSANLFDEMDRLAETFEQYPYLAVSTEFPGVVSRPIGTFATTAEYHYQTLKCNVDVLKPLQIGFSLADKQGKRPPGTHSWQFHLAFNVAEDIYAQDSMDALTANGFDFARHQAEGAPLHDFGEALVSSGLVLNDEALWVTHHSGYDFAYLMRLLTCVDLPKQELPFNELLHLYFPRIIDTRQMITQTPKVQSTGLSAIATEVGAKRIAVAEDAHHQVKIVFFVVVAKRVAYNRCHAAHTHSRVVLKLALILLSPLFFSSRQTRRRATLR
jgi:CCR4-NOT transcription complex subunit 7/8